MDLQCHPEVLVDRFESWLVAYSGEVAESGTTVTALRADTAKYGPALESAAGKMFGEWLDRFEPVKYSSGERTESNAP